MKNNKNFRMIKGILLHPFKAFLFELSGKRRDYNILLSNANYRELYKRMRRSNEFKEFSYEKI